MIERNNGYLETSFLPGRRFEDVADFNRQLTSWLRKANQRIHATTRVRPADAIFEDRGSMLRFPPVLPDPSWRFSTRLPRDHYVRVETNDYSVNPRFVGRRVEVRVILDQVLVTCDGVEVGRHRRCLAKHESLLLAEHARTLRAMRAEALVAAAFAGCSGRTRPHGLRPGDRGCLMATAKTRPAADIAYLCRALKAPSLAQAVDRLAERARTDGWTHEEFLAACLEREVAARQSNGGELRMRAARFPARKTLVRRLEARGITPIPMNGARHVRDSLPDATALSCRREGGNVPDRVGGLGAAER